jgi:hypothetical protein
LHLVLFSLALGLLEEANGMSKSKIIKNPDETEKKQPDYIEILTVPNSHKADADEAQEEDWAQQSSPLTGRMSGTMEELERIQSCELMYSDEVRQCLKESLECYQSCTETILHCLEIGGKHAESSHINLLLDCAKICHANADFIVRNSTYYPQTCGICADICDECGDVCDRFEDDFMKQCAGFCRRCAESCREMAR